MNILLLAPHPFFQERGTPIAVRLLATTLAGQGHAVDMLCYHEGQEVEPARGAPAPHQPAGVGEKRAARAFLAKDRLRSVHVARGQAPGGQGRL